MLVLTSSSGMPLEQRLHVLDRADGHANAPDLTLGHRIVGVVAHLCRQVERDRQSRLSLPEQVAEPRVGLGRGPESRVLPHRPEAAAIHRRLDAARERKLAGQTQRVVRSPVGGVVRTGHVVRDVDSVYRQSRPRRERALPLGKRSRVFLSVPPSQRNLFSPLPPKQPPLGDLSLLYDHQRFALGHALADLRP